MSRCTRGAVLAAVLALSVALVGCGSGTSNPMPGFGPMMGRAPGGYHLRALTCEPPSSLPGTVVRVMVGDMGASRMMGGVAPMGSRMMLRALPTTVRAGKVSFLVANMGWRTHELVVLPLAAGQSIGERVPDAAGRIDESGSLGEASASCAAGSGEGITSAALGWVTLTLAPGRYELVCNLRNHYANGMYAELTVR